jgi:hypothetical protein
MAEQSDRALYDLAVDHLVDRLRKFKQRYYSEDFMSA